MIEVALPGARVLFTEAADGDAREALPDVGRPVRAAAQVHGTAVGTDERELAEADAQVTARPDVAVAVRVADCVPIAVASDLGVAVVHAGWRGLAAGVVEAALAELPGTPRAAVVGPCAGPCCYEVGDEVRAAFGIGTAHADLPALAEQRLRAAGVPEVEQLGLCTVHDARFWSFRRQGEAAGRQAVVAWRS